MKKTIRLTERDLTRLVKRVISEQEGEDNEYPELENVGTILRDLLFFEQVIEESYYNGEIDSQTINQIRTELSSLMNNFFRNTGIDELRSRKIYKVKKWD
jgi:hypothetical protein